MGKGGILLEVFQSSNGEAWDGCFAHKTQVLQTGEQRSKCSCCQAQCYVSIFLYSHTRCSCWIVTFLWPDYLPLSHDVFFQFVLKYMVLVGVRRHLVCHNESFTVDVTLRLETLFRCPWVSESLQNISFIFYFWK